MSHKTIKKRRRIKSRKIEKEEGKKMSGYKEC